MSEEHWVAGGYASGHVSCIQKDLAILREENHVLRTPATSVTGDTGSTAGGAHDDESAVVRRNY